MYMLVLAPSGIPCRHVVSTRHYICLNLELYIYFCYMREAYKICNENNVSTINGIHNMHFPMYLT